MAGRKPSLDKIDIIEFGNAYIEFQYGLIGIGEFAERCGVTTTTLKKHFEALCGKLDLMLSKGDISVTYPKKNEKPTNK